MGDVLFLILRRLRAPLIALIVIYATSIAGLVAIPGVDGEGKPWHMGFFQAFYVTSYTATTIGFGEIPYAFTDAQRIWVTVVIYLSVIGWAYALGAVFALSQDPVFREAAARAIFNRRVASLRQPYCVVCGYGRSGEGVVRALDALGIRVVVVEIDPQRVATIAVHPFRIPPLVLVADPRRPEVLRDAGIAKPECRAVIALTGDDESNQAIAIGTRVLDPNTRVLTRVVDPVVQSNLQEFGGIHFINPFDTFASNIGVGFTAPGVLQIEEWLTGSPGSEQPEPLRLPRGHWVLAGYGRFGQPIARALEASQQSFQAFDTSLMHTTDGDPRVGHFNSIEEGLRGSGIDRAVGVVAGSDSDTANLSIAVMARRVNPEVTIVIRRNKYFNQALVDAARPALTFSQSDLMLHEVLQALTTPLLDRFLDLLRVQDAAVVEAVRERLETTLGKLTPFIWTFECDSTQPGLQAVLSNPFTPLRIGELLINPNAPGKRFCAVPLLLARSAAAQRAASATIRERTSRTVAGAAWRSLRNMPGSPIDINLSGQDGLIVMPDDDTALAPGDLVLFAGLEGMERKQRQFQLDPGLIEFVRTGFDPPRGLLLRWLAARRTQRAARTTV